MKITSKRRIRSVETFKEYVSADRQSFNPKKVPTKMPSLMDIQSKDKLLTEYLRVNNIMDSGFFGTQDLIYVNQSSQLEKLPLIKERLKKKLNAYASVKEKVINQIFETGHLKDQAYQKVFKNIHNYYLLRTLLDIPSYNQPVDENLTRFINESKICFSSTNMDTVLKPLKCRICYSFIPIWLYVEHSNNCFGMNSLKKELVKINNKILGLCENIKEHASKINYEQIVKNKKETLESANMEAINKQKIKSDLRQSFSSKKNRLTFVDNYSKEASQEQNKSTSRDNSINKNMCPSKSIFNSYKNESKGNSDDPSFTARAKFLKQKTNIIEEIKSVNEKYIVSPISHNVSGSKGDKGSRASKGEKENSKVLQTSPAFPEGSKTNDLPSIHAKRILFEKNDENSRNSSVSKSNYKRDNIDDPNNGCCVGDMFDDEDDCSLVNTKKPFSNKVFDYGFAKKNLTDYKSFTNRFNLDVNELKGYKKADSQKESKNINPLSIDEANEYNNKDDNKKRIDFNESSDTPNKDKEAASGSSNDKGIPFLLKKFNIDKSDKSDERSLSFEKKQKFKSKGYDMQNEINKIQMTEPDAKKSQTFLLMEHSLPITKVFSFKQQQLPANEETKNKEDLNNLFRDKDFDAMKNAKSKRDCLFSYDQAALRQEKINASPNKNSSNVKALKSENFFRTANKDDGSKIFDNCHDKALDDKSSVVSQEVGDASGLKNEDALKNSKLRLSSNSANNDLSDRTPKDFKENQVRETHITFGRNSQNTQFLFNRDSMCRAIKKKSNFPKLKMDDSLYEDDRSEKSFSSNKNSHQEFIGDMFADAFENPEPNQTRSTKIDSQLLKKALKKQSDSKEKNPKKQQPGSEIFGSGSRNSFTTTHKHSSFYHIHRNSIQNVSINLKDQINEKSHSHSSSSESQDRMSDKNNITNNELSQKSKKNVSVDDETKNENIVDIDAPHNWINKNISIVKEQIRNKPSTEELNRLGSLISKTNLEQPLQIASKTSLVFDQSGTKNDQPSSFKQSAGDFSPISRINHIQNAEFVAKEFNSNDNQSGLGDKNTKPVHGNSNNPNQDTITDMAPSSQKKIIRTTSKVDIWKKMHQTNTDYRKAPVKKEDNFDEYYMYLFNKEVQKYKESVLANPYLQNVFADQELLSTIDDYKEKIKRREYLEVIKKLQIAILERIENIKETRKFQNTIEQMNEKSNGRKVVREKFSRSFGNLSILDVSQESIGNVEPHSRNQSNLLLQKALVNSQRKTNLQVITNNDQRKSCLIPPEVKTPSNAQFLAGPDNEASNLAQPRADKVSTAKPSFTLNSALSQGLSFNNNEFLKPLKPLTSQISNETVVRCGAEEKAIEDNPKADNINNLIKNCPIQNNANKEESTPLLNRTFRKSDVKVLKRCQSDSEFVIQTQKEKIYFENTRNVSMEDFNVLKKLGKGAYGKVYLVSRKSTQDIFAMKVIKFSSKTTPQFIQTLQNEISILNVIKGDYLAKAYFSFVQNNCLCIIMEYLVGGDFRELLDSVGRLDNDVAKHYIAQLVLAIEELHSNQIIHRDLKPENLLLDKDGRLKLADFGLSEFYAKIKADEENKLEGEAEAQNLPAVNKKIVGTPDYIPPEILFGYDFADSWPTIKINDQGKSAAELSAGNLHRSSDANAKSQQKTEPSTTGNHRKGVEDAESLANAIDWWGVGCLLYEFCIGVSPYAGSSLEEVFANVRSNNIIWPDVGYDEDSITPEAKDLIERLLDRNPKTRLGSSSSADIKQHSFFKGINWNTLANAKAPIPINFSVPNKKERVKMSVAFNTNKIGGNESLMDADDLTMNRVDLLFEMNIKQFKFLK